MNHRVARLCGLVVALCAFLPGAALAQSMTIDATASNGTLDYFAGRATSGSPAIVVGRTLQNGELDTSFAGGGLLQIAAQPGVTNVQVRGIGVDHFGRMVIASVQDNQFVFVRLNSDGSTYGGSLAAAVSTDTWPGFNLNAVYAEPFTGNWYIVGSYSGPETANVKTAAIAHYYYGQRDALFGTNGLRTYYLGTADGGEFLAYAEVPYSFKLVVVGDALDHTTPWGMVAQLNPPNMDLDSTFASGGIYITTAPVGIVGSAVTLSPGGDVSVALSYPQVPMASNTQWLMLSSSGAYEFASTENFYSSFPIGDWGTFTASAILYPPNSCCSPLIAGTGIDAVTGQTYLGSTNLSYGNTPAIGPVTANDDVSAGAYPIDSQQFVQFGTRQSASGYSPLRARYWYDGTFDTDFSLGPNNTVPNAFAFPMDSNQYGPATSAISRAIRVTGVNAGTTSISVAGGSYYLVNDKNGCYGTAPTTSPGTAANGQWVCAGVTTATTPGTATTATITIGGVQASYTATTGTTQSATIQTKPASPSAANVQFTYFAPYISSNVTYQCQLDGAGFSACPSSGISYTTLAAGSHTFSVQAVNVWGPDPSPPSYTWSVAPPPSTTITSTPAALTNATAAFFYFSSSDSAATFECSLDNAAFAACTNPKNYTGLAAGAHSFTVRSKDSAGTDPSPPTYSWTIDTTPPHTTIASGPSGMVSASTATFTFSNTKTNVTYKCALDSGLTSACVSGVTYSGLAAGSHTFYVASTDAAGNVESPAVTRTWTIDTTPPHTTITSGPSGTTSLTSATFAFSSSKTGSTFQCSLDSAAYAACATGLSYSNLAGGSHTFSVFATDAIGNVEPTLATRTWSVDTSLPHTAILSGPSGLVASLNATFTFSTSKADATFQCSLDGAGYSSCYSGENFAVFDGAHTLAVESVDAAGRTDPTPPTASWTVDSIHAKATITQSPANLTNQANTTISFVLNDSRATASCNLDGAVTANCTSPVTATLADGSHSFAVTASNVGGADPSPPTVTWTIDTVPPTVTLTSEPAVYTNQTSATFTFIASKSNVTFMCAHDGSISACTSPVTYSSLAEGDHGFSMYAIDAAGNYSSNVPSLYWTVDTTPPATTVTSGPTADTSQKTAVFTFTSNEAGSTFVCESTVPGDVQGFHACTSPVTYSNIADGSYVFYVRAIDPAGNEDPNWHTYQWIVDATAPDTSISSGPPTLTNSTSATFTFGSNESNVTYQCALDAAAFAACTSPAGYSSLADGSHTFKVRATDGAGNIDPTPSTLTWTVDTSAPHATITSGPTGNVASTSATFTFASSESNPTFDCKLDTAAFAACAGTSISYTGLAQGAHTFSVRAHDAAGNVGPATSQSWTVDTVAPTASISTGPTGSVSSTSATFTYASSESGSTFDCKVDSGSFVSCAVTGVTYSGLAQGSHTFSVRAHDAAGNVSTAATRTWTVDTVAPDTTITGGPTGTTSATSATFTFTSTESPATFQCALDSGAWTACTSPTTYSGYSRATHTFKVRSIDAAGNVDATPASRTWTRN